MRTRYPTRHHVSSVSAATLKAFLSPLFIETGTNVGHGVQAALDAGFARAMSFEADDELFCLARDRFAGDVRVELYHGPSEVLLPSVTRWLREPSTFYLDAHSAECNPLLRELEAVALSPCGTHTILIDDVRMFGTSDWHGLTESEARSLLLGINPAYEFSYAPTFNGPADLLVARPRTS